MRSTRKPPKHKSSVVQYHSNKRSYTAVARMDGDIAGFVKPKAPTTTQILKTKIGKSLFTVAYRVVFKYGVSG